MSFTVKEIGNYIPIYPGKETVKDPVTGDYNITLDFAYEIVEKGGHMKYRIIDNVPLMKRVTEQNTDFEKCRISFHGNFNETTNSCVYFVEARKICFVLDQENDYHLDSDYENYRCNYLNYDKDYVMFFNMRWHKKEDPTLSKFTYGEDLILEFFFNNAPEVKTLNTLDVHNFDFDSRNYNLEFTIMLILSFMSLIICLVLLMLNHSSIF